MRAYGQQLPIAFRRFNVTVGLVTGDNINFAAHPFGLQTKQLAFHVQVGERTGQCAVMLFGELFANICNSHAVKP